MDLLYDADAIYGHASTQQPQKPRELEFFEMLVIAMLLLQVTN